MRHALRELVVNRADGYAMPNSMSPDRLEAHAGGLSNGNGHSGSQDSRQARHAETLAVVARAFESAYQDVSDRPTRRIYEYLLLARYVADKTPSDLAARLTDDPEGPLLTAKRIGHITRDGWLRIADVLESHELVPTRTHKQMVAHSDLLGWKAIAYALGVTPKTARRYHEALGMPVRHICVGTRTRAEASSEEVKAWRARRTAL